MKITINETSLQWCFTMADIILEPEQKYLLFSKIIDLEVNLIWVKTTSLAETNAFLE